MEAHLQMSLPAAATRSPGKEQLYPGHFLDHVVTPIYEVMANALRSKEDHDIRKTYDDFNEFFWSPCCLKYQVVHSVDADEVMEDGTVGSTGQLLLLAVALATAPKTYVEKRSYFHGISSFHRILEWHSIWFTILGVLGCSNDLLWTTAYTLQALSLIFIQINFFGIIWTCLEIWALFPSSSISNPSICGYLLRLCSTYVLLVFQCVYYYWSFDDSPTASGLRSVGDNSFWW